MEDPPDPIPVPYTCPRIGKCGAGVTWEAFKNGCKGAIWIFCPYARKEAKQYKRKPSEWMMIWKLEDHKDSKIQTMYPNISPTGSLSSP